MQSIGLKLTMQPDKRSSQLASWGIKLPRACSDESQKIREPS